MTRRSVSRIKNTNVFRLREGFTVGGDIHMSMTSWIAVYPREDGGVLVMEYAYMRSINGRVYDQARRLCGGVCMEVTLDALQLILDTYRPPSLKPDNALPLS